MFHAESGTIDINDTHSKYCNQVFIPVMYSVLPNLRGKSFAGQKFPVFAFFSLFCESNSPRHKRIRKFSNSLHRLICKFTKVSPTQYLLLSQSVKVEKKNTQI